MHSIYITTEENASPVTVDLAKAQGAKWGIDYREGLTSGLALVQQDSQLILKQLDEPKVGGVLVDFASDAATFRRLHGGGKKEAIAKAVGLKGQQSLQILDATAGLGRDAFVLASLGCKVDMIERSPVVAALLADGLNRAAHDPNIGNWIPLRMSLQHAIGYELLANWQGVTPDVVYLDPMFPHRKKTAAVKKEMRLFQQLLGPDQDANLLLEPALALAKKRVVVKRPAAAPYLAEVKPSLELQGKANRFDVYMNFI